LRHGVPGHLKADLGLTVAVERYLASAELPRTVTDYRKGETIFSQGDDADSIMYVLNGIVKLSVSGRREAVVGVVGSDDSFGEDCLSCRAIRTRNATAVLRTTVLVVARAAMIRLLRTEAVVADQFMAHLLARQVRLEDDLLDQLLSSCEQRLARTLLLLAGTGSRGAPRNIVPRMSQAAFAGIVGTTRSRINVFLQRFKTMGYIEMDRSVIVHRSLLGVVSPCLRRQMRGRAMNRR
jgi:CRP/FNR family cyclic AMP-dependent transcriptional regulator